MSATNRELREAFLSPQMRHYFQRKLAPLSKKEIRIRVEEALKFLNMAVYCKGQIPVSKEIDEIWHYWILETKEYRKLCSVLQGGKFLDHSSNHYLAFFGGDNAPKEIGLKRQVSMLAAYVLNYGPFKKNRIKYWPLASCLVKDCGWGLRELNRWLSLKSIAPDGRTKMAGLTSRRNFGVTVT